MRGRGRGRPGARLCALLLLAALPAKRARRLRERRRGEQTSGDDGSLLQLRSRVQGGARLQGRAAAASGARGIPCLNNCSYNLGFKQRGDCINGACVCELGYGGPDCSIDYIHLKKKQNPMFNTTYPFLEMEKNKPTCTPYTCEQLCTYSGVCVDGALPAPSHPPPPVGCPAPLTSAAGVGRSRASRSDSRAPSRPRSVRPLPGPCHFI